MFRFQTVVCVVNSCCLYTNKLNTVFFRKSCPSYLINHQKVNHLKLERAFKRVGLNNQLGWFFFPITGYDQIKSGRHSWNHFKSYHHQLLFAVPLPEVTSIPHMRKEQCEDRPQPLICRTEHHNTILLSLLLPA